MEENHLVNDTHTKDRKSKRKNETPSKIFTDERILSSDYDSEPDLNRIFRKYNVIDEIDNNDERTSENFNDLKDTNLVMKNSFFSQERKSFHLTKKARKRISMKSKDDFEFEMNPLTSFLDVDFFENRVSRINIVRDRRKKVNKLINSRSQKLNHKENQKKQIYFDLMTFDRDTEKRHI